MSRKVSVVSHTAHSIHDYGCTDLRPQEACALNGQDLPRTHLAHRELESANISIITIKHVVGLQGFVVEHDGYSKTQQAQQMKTVRCFTPPCTIK